MNEALTNTELEAELEDYAEFCFCFNGRSFVSKNNNNNKKPLPVLANQTHQPQSLLVQASQSYAILHKAPVTMQTHFTRHIKPIHLCNSPVLLPIPRAMTN